MEWNCSCAGAPLQGAQSFESLNTESLSDLLEGYAISFHGASHVQERRYSAHDAYSTSKLAMMLITAEHAQRLGSNGPTSNCLDPGTVNTKLLDKGTPK